MGHAARPEQCRRRGRLRRLVDGPGRLLSLARCRPRDHPALLGIEVDEEGLPDAIGEVTNMIAGAFRTRMAAFEDAWAISVPTVTVGSDFYMKPTHRGSRHRRLPHGRARDFVELIITPDAEAAVQDKDFMLPVIHPPPAAPSRSTGSRPTRRGPDAARSRPR